MRVYDRIEAYHTDFVGIDAEARRITGQLAARGCRRIGMLRQFVHVLWGIPARSKSPAVIVTAYRPDPVLVEPLPDARRRIPPG